MSSKIIAGTTSGTALNMSADTSGQLEIQTGSTPTTAITVTSGQDVGVGTSTMTGKLNVAGSSYGFNWYVGTNQTSDAGSVGIPATSGPNIAFYGSTASPSNTMLFNRGATESARFNGDGNLGVGTGDSGTGSAASRLSIQPSSINLSAIRTATNNASYANGATVSFTAKSGMVIVNNLSSGGISAWLLGGGGVYAIRDNGSGAFSFSGGSYVWTNNFGSTQTFSFTFIQTRDAV